MYVVSQGKVKPVETKWVHLVLGILQQKSRRITRDQLPVIAASGDKDPRPPAPLHCFFLVLLLPSESGFLS